MIAGTTLAAASDSDYTSRARLPRHMGATSKRVPMRQKPCSLCTYHVAGSSLIGAMRRRSEIRLYESKRHAQRPLCLIATGRFGSPAALRNWQQTHTRAEKAYLGGDVAKAHSIGRAYRRARAWEINGFAFTAVFSRISHTDSHHRASSPSHASGSKASCRTPRADAPCGRSAGSRWTERATAPGTPTVPSRPART